MKTDRISLKSFAGMGIVFLTVLFAFTTTTFGQEVDKPDPVWILTQYQGRDVIKGEALVQFEEGIPLGTQAAIHSALGTHKVETIVTGLDLVRFSKPLELVLDAYNLNPDVDYAEPNWIYYPTINPNDQYWSQQWGPKKIQCAAAWDKYKGNGSHVVALIDTGVDMDHPDLDDHYAWGYDYYANDPNPDDQDGHGSHTAGTAAAETNNSIGVAGVGFDCKFAAYRAGNYGLSTTAIVQSITDAKNKGALVISMSFSGGSSTSIKNALNSAYNAGMVLVAAAGNHGTTLKVYPAGHPFVIGVGASTTSDSRAGFSAYGPWVSVAAPGVNIISTYKNKNYAYADGTSMACPHVAGCAVILYSMIGGVRTKANSDMVRNALQDTALPRTWVEFGRVDLNAAMDQMQNDPPTITSISPTNVQAFKGGTITVTGTNFLGTLEVNSGGTILNPPDFTIVDNTTITYSAPLANALGQTAVTVTNNAGTSNAGYFNYIETNPPKMDCPTFASGGQPFTWSYGGGASDAFFLLISTDPTTFNFKGYPILVYFTILHSGMLNAAGTGSLPVTMSTGLQGLQFNSEVLFFDTATGNFDAADRKSVV